MVWEGCFDKNSQIPGYFALPFHFSSSNIIPRTRAWFGLRLAELGYNNLMEKELKINPDYLHHSHMYNTYIGIYIGS